MKKSWISKIRLYGNIFVPSALSLTLSTAIAVVTFFVYHLHIFLSHFEVSNGSLKTSNFISSRLNRLLGHVFGASAVNSAVLIMFWAAVGLIIYFIGRLLAKDISELSTEVKERNNFLWPKNTQPTGLARFFERALFSVAILIVLIFYCSRVLGFFLRGKPLAVAIFGPSAHAWLQTHTVANDIVFIIMEIIALHVVVVLLRLLFMRSRLFRH